MDLDSFGVPLVVALATLFLVWHVVGSLIHRRRVAATARWLSRGLELVRPEGAGGRPALKRLSVHVFNLSLEEARPPFRTVAATALLHSRDMLSVWLLDRLVGRRDMLLLRCELRRQPIWGLEVFRSRGLLAGDARRLATQEGWPIAPPEEDDRRAPLLAAHGGGKSGDLCRALLEAVGDERRRLVRLGIRRRPPHLTLALDLPDPSRTDPAETMRLAERLATITLAYST